MQGYRDAENAVMQGGRVAVMQEYRDTGMHRDAVMQECRDVGLQ